MDAESEPEISDAVYKSPDYGPVQGWVVRAKQWVLLTANRWVVSGVLTAAVFALTVLVGALGPASVRDFLVDGVSPSSVLVELLKAIVSLVTIVLSINQLVLSPELGPVSSQRDQIEDTMSLRRHAEHVIDSAVASSSPGRFLHGLLAAVAEQAAALPERVRRDGEVRRDLRQYADDVESDAEDVTGDLEGARFGKFEVVPAVMRFDVSEKIRRARRIGKEHGDDLSAAEREAIEEMVDRLELFATARAYLKTIYLRSEFINFSRALLYVGPPSLLLTLYATLLYAPDVFPGEMLGVENRLWFVSAAITVALAPFAVLIAYAARLATLSQSTLFVGPFVAGRDDGSDGGDDGGNDGGGNDGGGNDAGGSGR
ncbi:hypothetical protein [Halomarina pelagica]|uniref:hypothetical protein n=1 Tax=Halomarina pelagica TaxID=2961599 RepID=UPI0020C2142E|nr:hypothetical protein [Halomarina sp. BND7]